MNLIVNLTEDIAVATNRSLIEGELIRLLADIVDVDPSVVRLSVGLSDVGITSLQLVEAIFVIEEKYGISIPYNANDARIESVSALLDQIIDLILVRDGCAEYAVDLTMRIEDPQCGNVPRAVEQNIDGQWRCRSFKPPMIVLPHGVVRLSERFPEPRINEGVKR